MASSEVLEFQIVDNAADAVNGLNQLQAALERLRSATSSITTATKRMSKFGDAIHNAVTSTDVMNYLGLASALEKVAAAAANLKGINLKRISSAAAVGNAMPAVEAPKVDVLAPDVSQVTEGASEAINELTRVTGTATEAGEALKGAGDAAKEAGDKASDGAHGVRTLSQVLDNASSKCKSFFSSIARVATYRLIRTALKELTQGFSEGMKNLYQYSRLIDGSFYKSMDNLASANLKLKNSMGAMAGELMQAVLPVLQTLISWATQAVNAINQLIAVFRGQSTWTEATDQVTTWGDAVDQAVSGASKKVKNLLADWDELNIIQSESGGGGSNTSPNNATDYSTMFQQSEFAPWVKWVQEHLQQVLTVVGAIGAGLLAWKIAHAFTDNLKTIWGVAIAISGAFILAEYTLDAFLNGVSFENLLGQLAGTILLALGLGLAFGKTGFAIGLVIGGAYIAVASFYDQLKNGINWENMTGLVGGLAIMVLGLGLAFGLAGVGVGLLIAGVLLIIEPLRELIETGNLTDEALTQLTIGALALGVAFGLITGMWIPLAIIFFAALAAWIVKKWDWLCENVAIFGAIRDAYNSVSEWWNGTAKPAINAVVLWVDTNIVKPVGNFFTNLYKDVKKSLSNIGAWFSLVWSGTIYPLVTWINDNIIKPIGDFFVALWGTITGDEENNLGTWWDGLWNETILPTVQTINDDIIEPIKGFFTALWGTIKGDEENNLGTWWDGLWKNTIGPVVQWIQDNITTPIGDAFSGVVDTIKEAWKGLTGFFTDIINGVIGIINSFIDVLNKLNFTIGPWNIWDAQTYDIFGHQVELPALGIPAVTLGISGIPNIPTIPVETRAEGGFVNAGELFIARENGLTEMVGSIGNKTAVANNDQIIEGISYGVAAGQEEQNALLRQNNDLMRRWLMKKLVAEVVPSAAMGKVLKRSEELRRQNEGV